MGLLTGKQERCDRCGKIVWMDGGIAEPHECKPYSNEELLEHIEYYKETLNREQVHAHGVRMHNQELEQQLKKAKARNVELKGRNMKLHKEKLDMYYEWDRAMSSVRKLKETLRKNKELYKENTELLKHIDELEERSHYIECGIE